MTAISSCFVQLVCLVVTLHTISCARKPQQMIDIQWNPCSMLENPTPKQLEDATIYCKLVLKRFLRHPASPYWSPNIRNPQCSKIDPPPSEGSHFRCTVKFLVRFELRNPLTPVNIADFITDPTFWSYREWKNIGEVELEPLKNPESTYSQKLKKNFERVKIEKRWNDIGVYAAVGKRFTMGDTFMAYENAWGTGASFFGVFDGHAGTYAATYARDRLMKNIVNRVADLKYLIESPIETDRPPSEQSPVYIGSGKKGCHKADPNRWRKERTKKESKRKRQLEHLKTYLEVGGIINYQMFLTDVFKSTDLALCASARRREIEAGTTALIAIIEGSQLIVANVGDSRGLMCDSNGDPVPLSFDQKPNRKDETERLEKAGGEVSCDDRGIPRLDDYISMSRSLGDQAEKLKHHLIPDPEVFIFDLLKYAPKFIVLATDGLYDYLTNDQVVAFIHQRLEEEDFGAKSLVRYAYLLGAKDNITVMVIRFKNDEWPPNPRNGRKAMIPSVIRRKYAKVFG